MKFSMQTYLAHINIIFEYCHVLVILNNVDILYLGDGNTCRHFPENGDYVFSQNLSYFQKI